MKEMYSGCEIVMGNLEITMMEHWRDFTFLQSIREVTGYILIAINQFSRLPLDQLRIIRGTTLYEDRFALAVLVNYQKDGQHGLEELGLTHLTEILEGGVQIIQNKFLSYTPQVNWLDIVKDGDSEVIINENGPEQPCDEACTGPCWGPRNDTCQILTKTVCAPQCNGRCFGRSPSECCHMECAGGCTGPLDTDCFACRNFNNSGSCVPQCPQTLIYNKHTFKLEPNPSAKYQYGSICVAQCPTNFVVDGSSCVSSCPPYKTEGEKKGVKRCEPCGGLCPKGTCLSSLVKEQAQLPDRHDPYNNITALDPEKLKIFRTVREITDILSIQSWPETLTDLSVFSNLTTIQGRTLYRGYSLLVMRIPSLTSLGLRSLRRINDGGVYITGNKKLCYHHTVNWTRLFSSSSRPQRRQKNIDVKENRPQSQCVEEGHKCDPLCSSEGCWGPGPDQCMSCKNYNRGGTCVHQCRFLTGEGREFVGPKDECMPCHSECEVQEGQPTCTGPLLRPRHWGLFGLLQINHWSLEPLDPGEKGVKVHARILKVRELRKLKLLGTGVFGSIHKGIWIPEGDSVKIPVAIKTIHDRTGRQTFHEITDGDCSPSDSPSDESHHRGTELDHMEVGLEDQDEERLGDGMATPPLYLSQARSISRLSRMESHRGVHSSQAGYLPMTPGLDNPQMVWLPASRSRLNSARTVSESSEGRGTLVELEMSEDFLLAGSLQRKRHREDSAYMSQRDSMSGGPPETPSPDTEGEEDQNGYVLPGLGDSPERDTLLSSSRVTLPHGRTPKVPSYPSGPSEDHDSACEEYEYMNKQACMMSLSPRQQPGHSKDGQWLKMKKRQRSSLPSPDTEYTECTGHRTSAGENRGGQTKNEEHQDYESPALNSDSDKIEERGSGDVEYEYMDIRSVGPEASERPDYPPPRVVPHPGATPKQRMRGEREVEEEEEEDEYVEEDDYHYTNRQPKLRQALRGREGLRMQRGGEGEVDEYEDMDSLAAPGAGDPVEYENLQGEGEGVVGGMGGQRTGMGAFVKVRAGVGVGEPGGGDRSFDNPDYWQSRLFLKPNAVST
ncbi:unnamed protein product [Coregonus sp. 'balchen']|nr:unnamed protein product [Coregonus sp. 'balchen']